MRVLKVSNVSKKIKGKTIYSHISMEINEGDCYCLLGADYAGKTSIINATLGLESYDGGSIVWFEEEVQKKKFPKHVGYVPDDLLCFRNMTGAELLDATMRLAGKVFSIEDAEMLINYFGIDPSLMLESMDEDMNKCTYIVSALLLEPKVLVFDEPFNFLGEMNRKRLKWILKSYIKAGNTVIILSDNVEDIQDICTRFSAIRDGAQIRRDEELSWYMPAKMVTVHGLWAEDMDVYKSMEHVVAVKTEENESIFLYTGDVYGLKYFVTDLRCHDFAVRDLTIQEQIFKEYEWEKNEDSDEV